MSREAEELIEPATGGALALAIVAIVWAVASPVVHAVSLALLVVGPVAWPVLTEHWRGER